MAKRRITASMSLARAERILLERFKGNWREAEGYAMERANRCEPMGRSQGFWDSLANRISNNALRGKRSNPSLLILHNRTTVPKERELRKRWGEFHLKSGRDAKVISIPDIRGMPKSVMVLGLCEGIEIVPRRSASAQDEVISFDRHDFSDKEGPWLVTDVSMKKLWVVAKRKDDGRDLQDASGMFVRAVYYLPNYRSGKYEGRRGFRHELGETGEGGRPKSQWHKYYPRARGVGGMALELIRPKDGYYINDRGIVG